MLHATCTVSSMSSRPPNELDASVNRPTLPLAELFGGYTPCSKKTKPRVSQGSVATSVGKDHL